MTTLRRPRDGRRAMRAQSPSRRRCCRSPINSSSGMKLRSAGFANCSTSGCVPARICWQSSHWPHGSSCSGGCSGHNSACANRNAKLRLPIPGGPTNRNVLPSRPRLRLWRKCDTISSCPCRPCQVTFLCLTYRYQVIPDAARIASCTSFFPPSAC